MTRVEILASEVQALTPTERAAFREWFQNYEADQWDRQIEADLQAGKFDRLAEEALADHRVGKSKKL